MSNYIMLNDFSAEGIEKAIALCASIDLESRVEKIESGKNYFLFYDPDFHCLRLQKLIVLGPLWPNYSMSMEIVPIELFTKKIIPSKSGEIFLKK